MTNVEILKELRKRTGLTQTAFAPKIGLPLRTYQDIENGRSPVRPVHLNAARWAVFKLTGIQRLP